MGPFSGDFQRGVTVNETSPTSARYIDPIILHASLHVYCMDHNGIEQMI